jgi:hypothetical protein
MSRAPAYQTDGRVPEPSFNMTWVSPLGEALAGRQGAIFQQELTERLIAQLTGEPAASTEKR